MRRREILEGIRILEGHCRGEEVRFGPRTTREGGQNEPSKTGVDRRYEARRACGLQG